MNAADSVRGQLSHAAVAVAVPVEVREDSDIVVRLLIDPSRSAHLLSDSLASEHSAGMHVEPGTTPYGPTMTARLAATGAVVSLSTAPVVAVPSRGLTGWTWVLHPTKAGQQHLWITLTVVGVMPAGELPVYSLARDYAVRPDWRGKVGDFVWHYWWQIGTIAVAVVLWLTHVPARMWGYLKKPKDRSGREE